MDDRGGVEVDDGLGVEHEGVVVDVGLDPVDPGETCLRPGFVVLLAGELDPPVTSELLGVVHRDVGVHEHLVRRALDVVEDGDADAGAERDLFAGDGGRERTDLFDEALGDGASSGPVASREQHRELVTAEPRRGGRIPAAADEAGAPP